MITPPELKRIDGENEDDYIVRACSLKDKHQLTWQQLADILNEALGHKWNRRTYQNRYLHRYSPAYISPEDRALSEEMIRELREEKDAIIKERMRISEERMSANRAIRMEARREAMVDEIVNAIDHHLIGSYMKIPEHPYKATDTSIIAMLTDLHTGIRIDNSMNLYNADIMDKRMRKYAMDLINIQRRHAARELVVFLGGDMVSGIIYESLRLENYESVTKQVMDASDRITQFILNVAPYFELVRVVSVVGNHGRVIPEKDKAMKGENFDALIPYYLKSALANVKNVSVDGCAEYDEGIAEFWVQNNLVCGVHGDKDTPDNAVQHLSPVVGVPDVVLMGHYHQNGVKFSAHTAVITGGCLSESGVDCVYNIHLGQDDLDGALQ